MPTRKQRRRRDKTFRHEFDYVSYDEDGNEIEVAPAELRKEKKDPPKRKPQQRGSRPVREVEPPSWRRSFRRGGLMGGLMLVVMVGFLRSYVIGVVYAVMFIPLTYWIDRLAYRNYLRRSGKT